MRRLSFKIPVVFRYNLFGAVLFGTVHTLLTKKTKFFKYWILASPIGMIGLCLQ